MAVTEKNVKKLGDGRYLVERNLYLFVRNGGKSRCFIFRWMRDGVRQDFSIGSMPGMTLKLAKEEVARLRSEVALGRDPLTERKTAKKEVKEERERRQTFAEYYEANVEALFDIKRYKNPRTARGFYLAAKKHAIPAIGKMTLEEITPPVAADMLGQIWETRPGIIRQLRGHLEDVFNLAIRDKRFSGVNPFTWRGVLSVYLPAPQKLHEQQHFPAPTIADLRRDIPRIMTRGLGGNAGALVLGFLTATRRGEFIAAQWQDIDLEARVWSIPPANRKDGKAFPHRVPLSAQAIWLLTHTPNYGQKTGYCFTSIYAGADRPLSTAGGRALLRRAIGAGYVIHGVRSTFRDWAAEQGIDFVAAEKCLMHAVGSGIVRAYLRTDMLEQRRPIMQAWADTILPMEALEAVAQSVGVDAVLQRIGGTRDREDYRN